ncbi:MAG: hypothetical protein ABIF77_09480 [bacterium]
MTAKRKSTRRKKSPTSRRSWKSRWRAISSSRRLSLLGGACLAPPALFLFMEVAWHLGRDDLTVFVKPPEESILIPLLIMLACVVSPLVATSCGLGLLREKNHKLAAWSLLLSGPLLVIACILARP